VKYEHKPQQTFCPSLACLDALGIHISPRWGGAFELKVKYE
jgi:hypothetical protein